MKLETVSKCSNLKDKTGAGALEGEMGGGGAIASIPSLIYEWREHKNESMLVIIPFVLLLTLDPSFLAVQ